MERLIGVSAISHMGFVTLGFFLFNAYGGEGGLVQMISHGFVSAAMFLCVGVLYDRMHSRAISDYGGGGNSMPEVPSLMVLFAMADSGGAAARGLVGEVPGVIGGVEGGYLVALPAGPPPGVVAPPP